MKTNKVRADIAAYYVRQSFEEAYRAAKPQAGRSKSNPSKGEWFDHWLVCDARKVLVSNGLINDGDDYR